MNNERRATFLICAALFLGTLLLFSRALDGDFIDLDDPDYVTQNQHVRAGLSWAGVRWAFTTTEAGNWHPLTWLSHQLDWQLYGDEPTGHHATSIFFHALNAVLAFLALRKLTTNWSAGLRPGSNQVGHPNTPGQETGAPNGWADTTWLCAFSAALFAWHPLRVESVAWIAERKDVLSLFFGLLAFWSYATYAEKRRANQPKPWRFYFLTMMTFAAGLLCKSMLVTLPFVFLLLDAWPLGRFMIGDWRFTIGRCLAEKTPFLLLAAASSIITYIAQSKGGAVVTKLDFTDRAANAFVSVVRYLGKWVWPFDLAPCYPQVGHWPVTVTSGAILLVLGLSAVSFWQRRQRPWLLIGWLWFLGALVPVIGLLQVGLQAMADRYTYFPILGWQLAVCWSLREAVATPVARRLTVAIVSLVLIGGAARTWNQLGVWKNSRTLFEHALAVTKDNYLAHRYLGTTQFNAGRIAEAKSQFQRALEIKPDYAAAHFGLGACLEQQGQTDSALMSYHEAVRLQPGFYQAHQRLGVLFLRQHELKQAAAEFATALQGRSDFVPAHIGLGLVAEELDRPAEAITHYEAALAFEPDNAEAHYCLGTLLDSLNRPAEARQHLERAWQLNPNLPGLAEALAQARRDN